MDNEEKSIKKLNKDINILLCYLSLFPFSYLTFKLALSTLSATSQQFATSLLSLFYSIFQSKLTKPSVILPHSSRTHSN